MNKCEIQFAVVTNGKEVTTIGRSFIAHPPIRHDGKETKWFDDSRILKKGGAV